MMQGNQSKDALLNEYPEIENNEFVYLSQTDIKIYLPEQESCLKFYWPNSFKSIT